MGVHMSLATKSSQANIVVSLTDKDYKRLDIIIDKVKIYLDGLKCYYAFILHDKDINKDGERKRKHIHIVLFNSQRKRFSTFINELSESVDVLPQAINIEKLVNLEGSIQYLLHLHDTDKYLYDISELITNIPLSELDIYLKSESQTLTVDKLVNIIRSAHNRLDVISQIGLTRYNQLHKTINDIIRVVNPML